MNQTLIELKQLSKTYQEGSTATPVLSNINLTIKKGEFISIMGPSGSGKSTLLHILGFLLDYSSGKYFYNDKLYQNYNPTEAAQIRNQDFGFIFQSFNLLSNQTVYQNVVLPLIYSQQLEANFQPTAQKVIDLVKLTHRTSYLTNQLSGGEKQRVAIARALVNNPQVIFADEPTGNLDSKSGQIIMQILQKLHQNYGHTIILITHETSTAHHAERLIKIKDGQIESDTKISNRLFANLNYTK